MDIKECYYFWYMVKKSNIIYVCCNRERDLERLIDEGKSSYLFNLYIINVYRNWNVDSWFSIFCSLIFVYIV